MGKTTEMRSEFLARWVVRVLRGGALVFVLFYIMAFIIASLKRMSYPYELEWIEGGFLLVMQRVLGGKPIYTPPSLDYIPFIYPPLYYYLTAALARVVGVKFLALRLVSFTSALLTLLLIMHWVYREGRSAFAALSAAGFFAGSYRLSGTWFDVGRVDSLFLFLLMAGMYLLTTTTSVTGGILAGICLFLAAMTKQTALSILLPVLAYLFIRGVWQREKRIWATELTFALLLVLSVLWLSWRTKGWFWYYTVTIPGGFPVFPHALWRFWKDDVFPYVSLAFVTTLLFLWLTWARARWNTLAWYGIFFASVFLNTWLVRSHRGSYLNDLMPFHAMLALGLGLWVAQISRQWGRGDVWKEGPIALIVFLQLLALFYNPTLIVPDARHVAAGDQVVAKLAHFEGDILVPFHPYLAVRAGKRPHMHIAAAYDVLRSDPDRWGQRLREETRNALREQRFTAVVLDQPLFWLMDATTEGLLKVYYEGPLPLIRHPDAFRPMTGLRLRPGRLYIKKEHPR